MERAKKADQEKNADKTTKEAAQEPEKMEEAREDQQKPDMFDNLPNPCVYCGPTVRGVARQYTTYQGGIPDTLWDFIKKHPEARQLIVSTAQFPAMRRCLDTPGTEAAKLYKQVKERM